MSQSPVTPSDRRCVLALDVGGTKIAAAFVAPSGAILQRWEEPTETLNADACAAQVLRLIRHAMTVLAPGAGLAVAGIGIGVPGAVRRDGAVWAPNIPGWEALPLADLIGAEWSLPVAVESDRTTFVLAEHWLGAGRATSDLAVVILGTGVGVGLIIDGHLCRGFDGFAGSIGWTPVAPWRLEREEYRRWGSLEALAAGPGLSRRAGRALTALDRPVSLDAVGAAAVAQAAREGDTTARRLFQETGEWLGLALAGLVSLVNPELILLAGGLASASDLILPAVEATISEYAQPIAARQARLGVAALGRDAGVLGAAALLLTR